MLWIFFQMLKEFKLFDLAEETRIFLWRLMRGHRVYFRGKNKVIHAVLWKNNGPVLRKGFGTVYTEDFMQLAVTYSKHIRMKACPTMTVRNKSKTQTTLTEVEHKDAESKRSLLSTAREYRGGGSAG